MARVRLGAIGAACAVLLLSSVALLASAQGPFIPDIGGYYVPIGGNCYSPMEPIALFQSGTQFMVNSVFQGQISLSGVAQFYVGAFFGGVGGNCTATFTTGTGVRILCTENSATSASTCSYALACTSGPCTGRTYTGPVIAGYYLPGPQDTCGARPTLIQQNGYTYRSWLTPISGLAPSQQAGSMAVVTGLFGADIGIGFTAPGQLCKGYFLNATGALNLTCTFSSGSSACRVHLICAEGPCQRRPTQWTSTATLDGIYQSNGTCINSNSIAIVTRDGFSYRAVPPNAPNVVTSGVIDSTSASSIQIWFNLFNGTEPRNCSGTFDTASRRFHSLCSNYAGDTCTVDSFCEGGPCAMAGGAAQYSGPAVSGMYTRVGTTCSGSPPSQLQLNRVNYQLDVLAGPQPFPGGVDNSGRFVFAAVLGSNARLCTGQYHAAAGGASSAASLVIDCRDVATQATCQLNFTCASGECSPTSAYTGPEVQGLYQRLGGDCDSMPDFVGLRRQRYALVAIRPRDGVVLNQGFLASDGSFSLGNNGQVCAGQFDGRTTLITGNCTGGSSANGVCQFRYMCVSPPCSNNPNNYTGPVVDGTWINSNSNCSYTVSPSFSLLRIRYQLGVRVPPEIGGFTFFGDLTNAGLATLQNGASCTIDFAGTPLTGQARGMCTLAGTPSCTFTSTCTAGPCRAGLPAYYLPSAPEVAGQWTMQSGDYNQCGSLATQVTAVRVGGMFRAFVNGTAVGGTVTPTGLLEMHARQNPNDYTFTKCYGNVTNAHLVGWCNATTPCSFRYSCTGGPCAFSGVSFSGPNVTGTWTNGNSSQTSGSTSSRTGSVVETCSTDIIPTVLSTTQTAYSIELVPLSGTSSLIGSISNSGVLTMTGDNNLSCNGTYVASTNAASGTCTTGSGTTCSFDFSCSSGECTTANSASGGGGSTPVNSGAAALRAPSVLLALLVAAVLALLQRHA